MSLLLMKSTFGIDCVNFFVDIHNWFFTACDTCYFAKDYFDKVHIASVFHDPCSYSFFIIGISDCCF